MTTIPNVTTTTIFNVLVELELGVHENIVVEPNMNDIVEEDGNQMAIDEVQPPVSHIHLVHDDAPHLLC